MKNDLKMHLFIFIYKRILHISKFVLIFYYSDFVRGVGEIPPVVDEEACRKLLRKSTAALCAHLGVDSM